MALVWSIDESGSATINPHYVVVGTPDDGTTQEDITTDLQAAIDEQDTSPTAVTRRRQIVIAAGHKYVTASIVIPDVSGIWITGSGGGSPFVNTSFQGATTLLEYRGTALDDNMFEITAGVGHIFENLSLFGARNARWYATGTVTVAAGVVTLSGGTFSNSGDWTTYQGADIQIGDNRTWYEVASRDSSTQVTLTDTSVTITTASTFIIRNYVPTNCFDVNHAGDTSLGPGKHTFRNLYFDRFKTCFNFSPTSNANIDVCALHNLHFEECRTMMRVAHGQGMQWDCQHWRVGGCEWMWQFDGGGSLFADSIGCTADGNVLRLKDYTGESGTHDGSNNASVLTDSTASWTVGEHVGRTITNDTDGSSGRISANTATTITATLSGGTDDDWDASDAYSIADLGGIGRSNGMFVVNNFKKDGGGDIRMLQCDAANILAEVIFSNWKCSSNTGQTTLIGNLVNGVKLFLDRVIRVHEDTLTFDSSDNATNGIVLSMRDCQVEDEVSAVADIFDLASSSGEINIIANGNFQESGTFIPPIDENVLSTTGTYASATRRHFP